MGLNHIDARLGVHCNYGVLDPDLDPLFGGTPNTPYSSYMGYRLYTPIPASGLAGIGVLTPYPGTGVWG